MCPPLHPGGQPPIISSRILGHRCFGEKFSLGAEGAEEIFHKHCVALGGGVRPPTSLRGPSPPRPPVLHGMYVWQGGNRVSYFLHFCTFLKVFQEGAFVCIFVFSLSVFHIFCAFFFTEVRLAHPPRFRGGGGCSTAVAPPPHRWSGPSWRRSCGRSSGRWSTPWCGRSPAPSSGRCSVLPRDAFRRGCGPSFASITKTKVFASHMHRHKRFFFSYHFFP